LRLATCSLLIATRIIRFAVGCFMIDILSIGIFA